MASPISPFTYGPKVAATGGTRRPGWTNYMVLLHDEANALANRLGWVSVTEPAYNAAGNGTSNDTSAVQAAINAVIAAGGGGVLFPPGTYLVQTITVTSASKLTLYFQPGAVLKASPTIASDTTKTGRVLEFVSCNDLALVSPVVDGNRANISSVASGASNHGVQNAIGFDTCNRVTIIAPNVSETVHDAFSCKTVTRLEILGGHVTNTGEHGVYFSTSSADCVVDGLSLENLGILAERGSWLQCRGSVSRVKFKNCSIKTTTFPANIIESSSDVLVEGCTGSAMATVYNVSNNGVAGANVTGVRFVNNVFRSSGAAGTAYNVNGTDCDDMSLIGNRFVGFKSTMNIGTRSTVVGNEFVDHVPVSGAAFQSNGYATIQGNRWRSTTGRVVYLAGADNVFTGNTIDTGSEVGVAIDPAATDTVVVGNRITACTSFPIWNRGTRSVIVGNNLNGNTGALTEAGTSTQTDLVGLLSVTGTGSVSGLLTALNLAASGAAATVRSLGLQTAGVDRWLWSADSDAESGSNAGSTLKLFARSDAGAALYTVLQIGRALGVTQFNRALSLNRTNITYSASMTPDASASNTQIITANNGTAFTINNPTNATTGQRLTITIRNTSGGALGAITWGAKFKMATFTAPATGFSRTVSFIYDGTDWIQDNNAADVPN